MRAPGTPAPRLILLAALALGAPIASAGELTIDGIVLTRAIVVEGQPSWLEGGYGRLLEGADAPGDTELALRAQAHLGLDWKGTLWRFHAHGVAQDGPAETSIRPRLVEAWAEYAPDLTSAASLRLRAGGLFPGTSLENTGPLWSSPYTLTLSALNTWTAEELRLLGVDGMVRLRVSPSDEVQVAGTMFGANDSMGSLIAWRGFTLGDRITGAPELLPLPPLRSLARGGGFAGQRADGTRPFDELDRRPGWQVRARWERPQTVVAQVSYLDSRGDRRLHRGQYSWRSRFGTAGVQIHLSSSLLLLGEAMVGETGMGMRPGPNVDLRYALGYGLVSWSRQKVRLSARLDAFHNTDRDGVEEPNGEHGIAWTAAVLWQARRDLRVGTEMVEVRARRPAAAYSGADDDTDARRIALELRFTF